MKKEHDVMMANSARDLAEGAISAIVERFSFHSWHVGVANALANNLVALCSALNGKDYKLTADYVSKLVNRPLAALQKKTQKKPTLQPRAPSPGQARKKSQ